MKPPIVIVAVLLAVLVGAGGAYFVLKPSATGSAAADEAPSSAQAQEVLRINNLLRQTLYGEDPMEPRSDDTRAAGRILAAAAQIDQQFANDPTLAAALRHTYGRALVSLAQLPEGQRLLQQAVEARRAMTPVPQADLARTLLDLGSAYYWQGQLDMAEVVAREAADLHRAVSGEQSDALAADLSFLAAIVSARNDHAQAEQILRGVLDMRRALYGPNHRDVALALKNLAVSLIAQKKLDEAIQVQREALQVIKSMTNIDSLDVAGAQINLAQALLATNDGPNRVEAIALLKDSLDRKIKALGQDHVSVAITQQQLGDALRDAGEISESEVALAQSLDLFKARNAPPSFTAAAALGLGRTLMLRAADDVAEPYLREALELRSRGDRARIPEAALWLGRCLAYQKKYEEAESMLETAYNFGLETPGPDNRNIAREAGDSLIKMFEEQGRPDKIVEWHAKMNATSDTSFRAPTPPATQP